MNVLGNKSETFSRFTLELFINLLVNFCDHNFYLFHPENSRHKKFGWLGKSRCFKESAQVIVNWPWKVCSKRWGVMKWNSTKVVLIFIILKLSISLSWFLKIRWKVNLSLGKLSLKLNWIWNEIWIKMLGQLQSKRGSVEV